jgi:Tfp pilus assembly protein PilN
MKAVNLIPVDERRGGGGGGNGGYVILGVLAALVLAVGAWVATGNSVKSKKDDLARKTTEVATAESKAEALRPYREFAALSQTRTATVASLAKSRFDWDRALRDVARVLPRNVWLTALTGSVAPGVQLDGSSAGGDTGPLRSSIQAPALEMVGCTTSQSDVAKVVTRLRLVRGATRVSLGSSQKSDGGGGGGGTGGDCRNGNQRFPQFQVVVFFTAPPAASAPTAPAPAGTIGDQTGASDVPASTSVGGAAG